MENQYKEKIRKKISIIILKGSLKTKSLKKVSLKICWSNNKDLAKGEDLVKGKVDLAAKESNGMTWKVVKFTRSVSIPQL